VAALARTVGGFDAPTVGLDSDPVCSLTGSESCPTIGSLFAGCWLILRGIMESTPRPFWATAFRREIVGRAVRTAVLVGSLLAAINHGPALVSGSMSSQRWFQMGLTYLVPYCVATYSAAMQELRHRNTNGQKIRSNCHHPVVNDSGEQESPKGVSNPHE
jgi:hypothetical protein